MRRNNLSIILFVIGLCCLNAFAKYYCPKNTNALTIAIDGKPDFDTTRMILDDTRSAERYFARDGSYYYFGIQMRDSSIAARTYRKHFFVSTNPFDEKERFTFHWDEMKPIITSTLDNDPEMECVTSASYSECRVKNMWNTLEIVRSSTIDPLDHATICALDFTASAYQQGSDAVEEMERVEVMLAEQTTNTTLIAIRQRNYVISGILASVMLVITFVIGIIFLFRERVPDSVAFEKKDN